jgi:hypothetical protein
MTVEPPERRQIYQVLGPYSCHSAVQKTLVFCITLIDLDPSLVPVELDLTSCQTIYGTGRELTAVNNLK